MFVHIRFDLEGKKCLVVQLSNYLSDLEIGYMLLLWVFYSVKDLAQPVSILHN